MNHVKLFLGGYMRSAELFRSARVAKGLKQSVLAELGGISCSALARFEGGKLRLSEETLTRLAPHLDINPKYLEGNSDRPFLSRDNKLIKFYVDKYKFHQDPIIAKIIGSSDSLEFYSLSPHLSIIERIRYLNIADHPTYAMVIKDEFNNVFIFRCKSSKDFMSWDDKRTSWDANVLHMTNKSGHFEKQIMSKDLYEKIVDWENLELEDLQFLFLNKKQNTKLKTIVHTELENEMVHEFRDNHINPIVAINSKNLLSDIEKHEIDPEDARSVLKRYYGY